MNNIEKKCFLNELKRTAIKEMRKQDFYKCMDGVICMRISHHVHSDYCGMNVDEIDKCMQKYKNSGFPIDIEIVNAGVANGGSKYDGVPLCGLSITASEWLA